MKPVERRVTPPFNGFKMASVSPRYRTPAAAVGGPMLHSVNPSPASLQGTDYPGECAPCQLNSDIHVASTILLLLWAARSLRKTSTPCRGLLLWEYSSPMGGGWSSSQSTESSSVSTTMWHSRSPFLAQPTMMGKISSSR